MWNKPTLKQLEKVPDLYSQENVKDKKIYLKLFLGSWTWYIAEIDHKNYDTMFGYVISPMGSEWGYISLKELIGLKQLFVEVDRDIYSVTPYKPKKFSELMKEEQNKDFLDDL